MYAIVFSKNAIVISREDVGLVSPKMIYRVDGIHYIHMQKMFF